MATRKKKKSAGTPTATDAGRGPGDPRVVAVTGAFGALGKRLVRKLEDDPDVDRVVCIDIRNVDAPTDPQSFFAAHPKLSAHAIDLTEAGAGRELAVVLENERVGAVFHLAFLSSPVHALEMAHELETIGSLYVFQAAAAARVRSVVSLSSTMCYGARPDNPAWITEDQPLRPPASRSIRDKAEADTQAKKLADEHPAIDVAIARVGAVLGSAPDHFWTKTFSRPVIPAVLGYDPLMQMLIVDDAIDALYRLFKTRARGAFNVVGRGVLPLSHIITRLGRAPLYLPAGIGSSIVGALWSAQLVDMPRQFFDYLRWPWVCDGGRIRKEIGWQAEHDLATTLSVFSNTKSRSAA